MSSPVLHSPVTQGVRTPVYGGIADVAGTRNAPTPLSGSIADLGTRLHTNF